jgi:hypothetical protein
MISGRFPVVTSVEEALTVLRAGSGVGIDLTGKCPTYAEAAMEILRRNLEGGPRRSAVVCIHTLEEGWPVDSGDFAAHGTGECLEGPDPCTKVLVTNPMFPRLKVPLDVEIGGSWNGTNEDAGTKPVENDAVHNPDAV